MRFFGHIIYHSVPLAEKLYLQGSLLSMSKWRKAKIQKILLETSDFIRLELEIVQAPANAQDCLPGTMVHAGAIKQLVGSITVNDQVLLEVGPLTARLGTGGLATVVALADRIPDDVPAIGHIVKARYTPLQVMTQAADEQGSKWHTDLQDADSIAGMPVVVADLHSALSPIISGIYTWRKQHQPDSKVVPNIVYIMLDGGALPAAWSNTLRSLKTKNLLNAVITAGQSFGGDLEAVNVYSALLIARFALAADICVLAQGPGNIGTDTRWGFSGTAVGEAINAVHILQGAPVACLRMSGADRRARHQGISHHCTTVIEKVVMHPVIAPLPDITHISEQSLPDCQVKDEIIRKVKTQIKSLSMPKLDWRQVDVKLLWQGITEFQTERKVSFSTMGRDIYADPLSFLAASASGYVAAQLLWG